MIRKKMMNHHFLFCQYIFLRRATFVRLNSLALVFRSSVRACKSSKRSVLARAWSARRPSNVWSFR